MFLNVLIEGNTWGVKLFTLMCDRNSFNSLNPDLVDEAERLKLVTVCVFDFDEDV